MFIRIDARLVAISFIGRLFSLFLAIAQLASAGHGADNPRLERLCHFPLAVLLARESHAPQLGHCRRFTCPDCRYGKAGSSDDEIKSAFIEKYGKRILATPEGKQWLWLFWTPLTVIAAGLLIVLLFLKRSRFRAGVCGWAPLPPAELEDNWDGI